MSYINRRRFFGICSCAAAVAAMRSTDLWAADSARFLTRGVVLLPGDLSLTDWPERAARAGLTTIGLHHGNSPQLVIDCVKSPAGQEFLEKCKKLGLQVEYELHAMRELLPRNLFEKNPELFRMNEKGDRTPDSNCCVHNERTLQILADRRSALPRRFIRRRAGISIGAMTASRGVSAEVPRVLRRRAGRDRRESPLRRIAEIGPESPIGALGLHQHH